MFISEEALVNTIVADKNSLLYSTAKWQRSNKDRLEVLKEIDLGHGIADLVLTKSTFYHEKSLRRRSKQLKYNDLFILKVIAKHTSGISFDFIQGATKLSAARLKSILKNLGEEGMIIVEDGRYVSNYVADVGELEVVAIEAKLKDWKRALKQAYRYKWFASYSYVFLDANYIKPALQNKAMFKAYNIGLAAVHLNGTIEIQVKPQKIKPYDEVMELLLREVLLFGSQK